MNNIRRESISGNSNNSNGSISKPSLSQTRLQQIEDLMKKSQI